MTIHDLTLHLYPGQHKNRWYHRLAYRTTVRHITQQAQAIIAVSHHTEQDLIKYLGLPADKIKVIYEGIETAPVAPPDPITLSRFQITAPYLVYVGVFRTHKNIDGLLKAFAIAKKVYQLPHHLVLVGSQSAEYENLKQQAKQLHIADMVHFTGRLNDQDMGQILRQSAAFVFPSFYEGFGLPPLEAMALGTPCLCAQTSSIPEVCGDAALYFDPRNPYDMAEKINHLLTHPTAQELLKQRGAEQIKKFSWQKMANEIWQLYLNLPA